MIGGPFAFRARVVTEPSFFPAPEAMTMAEIAALTGAVPASDVSTDRRIGDIASLERAGADDATFFESRRYAGEAQGNPRRRLFRQVGRGRTRARGYRGAGDAAIPIAPIPLLGRHLVPDGPEAGTDRSRPAVVSPQAHVDPEARLEAGVTVEPGAVIGPDVEIGRGTMIGAGAVIGPGVRIGRDCCRLAIGDDHPRADRQTASSFIPACASARTASASSPAASGTQGRPRSAGSIIQDNVEIGANTTIDRGAIGDTVIGEGTKIDNLVQIAHNVRHRTALPDRGEVGISGSVTIGDFVMMGGGVGIAGQLTIGSGASLRRAAAVSNNVPAGETWGGFPATR